MIIYRYSDRKHNNTYFIYTISIHSTKPSCLLVEVQIRFEPPSSLLSSSSLSRAKSLERTLIPQMKKQSGQWTPAWSFTESGLGIRSSSLDSPPPPSRFRAGTNNTFKNLGIRLMMEGVSSTAPLSAIKVVVKLYHACYYIAIRGMRFVGSLEDSVSHL